jgi:xanthine dehydrogenase accessory factor
MNVFAAAAKAWRTGQRAALATVIEAAGSTPRVAGARMLVFADGSQVGTIGGGELERRATVKALEVLSSGVPERLVVHTTRDLGMCCGGRMEVYVEPLQPRLPIVIFGAGHVAKAVAPVLRSVDFEVIVVDGRDELCTEARFPDCTLHNTDPLAYAQSMLGGPDAWWLVLTHDHKLDQDIVEHLLNKPCAWLGMIGSQAKVVRFLVRYRAAGMDERRLTRLCAPVGLDVGAETPGEIAVAIAAEVIRVRRNARQSPEPLSFKPLDARGGDGRAWPPAWTVPSGE